MLTYKGKRTLFFVISLGAFLFFCYKYIKGIQPAHKESELISAGLVLFAVMVSFHFLPSTEKVELYWDIPGIFISCAVKYVVEQAFARALLLAVTGISFFFVLYNANGYCKGLKTNLNILKTEVISRILSEIDWISKNQSNPKCHVDVIHVNTIPKGQNYISGMERVDLWNTTEKFCNGTLLECKKKRHLLLLGDFGSGKSTALLKYAEKVVGRDFVFPNEIPVYIKLSKIFDTEKLNEISNIEYPEIGKNIISCKEYIVAAYSQYVKSDINNLADFISSLEENGRIVFLFDGLNEVLQANNMSDQGRKDIVKKIIRILDKIAIHSRYVLTTCTYSNVITKEILENEIEDAEIYVIKGIEIDEELSEAQKKNQYETIFNSSVALHRLSKRNKDLRGGLKPTPYRLLERYAQKVLGIGVNDEVNGNALKEKLNTIIDDNLDQCRSLYLPLKMDEESDISNSNMFLKQSINVQKKEPTDVQFPEENDNKPEDSEDHTRVEVTICHALFFEFMLAQYALTKLEEGDQSKLEAIFGEKGQFILECQHICDAFKILVTEIYANNTALIETCNGFVCGIVPDKEEDKYKYFLVLSKIKDDILLYSINEGMVGSFGLMKAGKWDEKIQEIIAKKTPPIRFQMHKLFRNIVIKNCKIETLLEESLNKKWTHTGIQRQILRNYFIEKKTWPQISEGADAVDRNRKMIKRLDKYFMQEYPAEIIKLNNLIKSQCVGAFAQNEKGFFARLIKRILDKCKSCIIEIKGKEQTSLSFFTTRIHGIKNATRIWYPLLMVSLFAQIVFLLYVKNGINWITVIIKAIGFVFSIGSYLAWRKQLWKNDEYYGWALGNFSREEPIYEVLKIALGWNKIEEGATDKDATIVLGDWIKNRPSILFLLNAVISVVYFHSLLQDANVSYTIAIIAEIALALFMLFICCIPFSTWRYIKRINEKKDRIKILGLLFGLSFVVFALPIMATTWGELQWGMEASIVFSAVGFTLFALMWLLLYRKAVGMGRKIKSPIRWALRIFASLVFCILFSAPGVVLYYSDIIGISVNPLSGKVCVPIAIALIVALVYSYLFYISWVRKKRKEQEEKKYFEDLFSIPTNVSDDDIEKIKKYYKLLSCSGQIELLNKIINKEIPWPDNKDMDYFEDYAKTVQALDIILDAEI